MKNPFEKILYNKRTKEPIDADEKSFDRQEQEDELLYNNLEEVIDTTYKEGGPFIELIQLLEEIEYSKEELEEIQFNEIKYLKLLGKIQAVTDKLDNLSMDLVRAEPEQLQVYKKIVRKLEKKLEKYIEKVEWKEFVEENNQLYIEDLYKQLEFHKETLKNLEEQEKRYFDN